MKKMIIMLMIILIGSSLSYADAHLRGISDEYLPVFYNKLDQLNKSYQPKFELAIMNGTSNDEVQRRLKDLVINQLKETNALWVAWVNHYYPGMGQWIETRYTRREPQNYFQHEIYYEDTNYIIKDDLNYGTNYESFFKYEFIPLIKYIGNNLEKIKSNPTLVTRLSKILSLSDKTHKYKTYKDADDIVTIDEMRVDYYDGLDNEWDNYQRYLKEKKELELKKQENPWRYD